MTTNKTNKRVQQTLLAICISVGAQLPIVATADTQVKLQSLSNQLRITEGYTATVEQWQAISTANATEGHLIILGHESNDADVWVADVGTSLFADHDHDGYFGGFSLSFDVDTGWGERDIYATIYLQLGVDSPVKLHTTEIFTIYSRSGSDIYRVDAELVDNYRAGNYHVQIDIHDANYGDVLDSVNADSFRNLRNLPLEAEPHRDTTSAVIITEFAGFSGPLFLGLLALAAVLRRAYSRQCIIGRTKTARVRPADTNYEQLPNNPPTGPRLPF